MPRRPARNTQQTSKAKAQKAPQPQKVNAKASGSKAAVTLPEPSVDDNEDEEFNDVSAVEDEDEESEEEYEVVKKTTGGKRKRGGTKSTKKSSQPPKKKAKGTVDFLNFTDLSKVNFDVLHEIFEYLSPMDVFNMSQSNKANREFLYSPECKSMWKAARRNVLGLPKCPDDLTEVEYAQLAFGKTCDACKRRIKLHTIWAARTKLCSGCIKARFSTVGYDYERKELKDLLFFLPAYRLPGESIICLVGSFTSIFCLGGEWRYCDKTKKEWNDEYLDATNKSVWLQAKISKHKAISDHAKACRLWQDNFQNTLKKETQDLREDRKDVILDRLTKMGWESEVNEIRASETPDGVFPFSMHPTVVKLCRKDITERIFQNQRVALEEYMQEYRQRRLARDRHCLLRKRLPILQEVVEAYELTVSPNIITPSVGDFFRHEEISNFVLNTPDISSVADFKPIRVRLPEIVQELQATLREKVLALIKDTAGEYTYNPDTVLDLATTTFRCEACEKHSRMYRNNSVIDPIGYPRVLAHACARAGSYTYGSMSELAPADKEIAVVENITNIAYWNRRKKIMFNVEARQVLKDLIESCGMDPGTTTKAAMDQLDPIFECLTCNNRQEGRFTMRWDLVPHHFQKAHSSLYYSNQPKMNLEILKGEDADTIRKRLDEEEQVMVANPDYQGMVCAHCHEAGNTVKLRRHVVKEHKIAKPGPADIVRKIDSENIRRFFKAWPPREEVRPELGNN